MNQSSSTNINKKRTLSQTLSKLSKDELKRRDVFGRTILHLLILSNRYDLLRHLLKNPYIKSILTLTDFENGWNCLHYIVFHKKLTCFKPLIEFLSSDNGLQKHNILFELLKSKDRNKLIPLQLLDNDFKDLIWIPEYINEKNEYHLTYRYKQNRSEEEEVVGKGRINRKISIYNYHNWWNNKRCGSEIYMFGSNSNNNLGVGDARDRSTPSKISHEYFKVTTGAESSIQDVLMKPRYKKINISKNHSIVLTKDGELFSCGVGSRGRLGHGFNDLNNCFRFKLISYFSDQSSEDVEYSKRRVIKDIAISSNHSIALTTVNELFSWGLNNFNQLGYSSLQKSTDNSTKNFLEAFEALPKEIFNGDLKRNTQIIKGIAVSKIHSIAFTKNELFFWGLNIGQMGTMADKSATIEHKVNGISYKGQVQCSPKKVTLRHEIKLVETSETCTCVITTSNDIHLYYQYQHFKLPKIPVKGSTEKHFDLFKPIKLTQAVNLKKVALKSHEFIALLLDNGDVMSFSLTQDDIRNIKYNSIWKSYDRDMKVVDIDVSVDGSIILCTRNGSVFMKTNQSSSRKNSMTDPGKLLIPITKNKFKKLDNLNMIVKVSCDDNFLSFGFIRDEVDLLPLKLRLNDFFKDMEYLSSLKDIQVYRKQENLLNFDKDYNSYVTDFVYSNKSKEVDGPILFHERLVEDDELDEEPEESNHDISDILFDTYNDRFDATKHKRIKSMHTYRSISNKAISQLINELKSDDSFILHKYSDNSINSDKNYDCYIKFQDHPEISIGIHKKIFEKRSVFCSKIFNPKNPGEYFFDEGIEGRFDADKNELIFKSSINVKSVLILVYFIYTNKVLNIWDNYSTGINCPDNIKLVKADFEELLRVFQGYDLYSKHSKDEVYLNKIRSLIDDEDGDVLVKLKDGKIKCYSSILVARSAFFETILSNRWGKNGNVLHFENLTLFQFNIILRYLYGYSDEKIFNCFKNKFSHIDEFINCLLELIEVADELLLFKLKALCQLAIKDFITLENVMVLLTHSDNLRASKLFMNCCWFIYNNLEILLFDSSFKDLPYDLLEKLQKQILFFHNCKSIDFSNKKGELNENFLINWFENKSNILITNFLFNMEEFNEFFISDRKGCRGFKPLVDVKYEQKLSSTDNKKKKDRKNLRKSSTINAEIIAFRKDSSTINEEITEVAVEDSIDDDFEEVTNNRKRKSKMNSSPTPPVTTTSSRSSSQSDLNSSKSESKNTNLSYTHFPSLNEQLKQTSIPTASIQTSLNGPNYHSNWSPSHRAPILGKSPELMLNNNEGTKRVNKIKFSPAIRLSQKERKKMVSQNSLNDSNEDLFKNVNPWSNTSSSSSSISSNISDLPALGGLSFPSTSQKSKQKITSPINRTNTRAKSLSNSVNSANSVNRGHSTPSLMEIMIQESLKIEDAKLRENERKSLLEIQQEQEFAKWWEEETARVQKQMEAFEFNKRSKAYSFKDKPNSTKRKHKGAKNKHNETTTETVSESERVNYHGKETSSKSNKLAKSKNTKQV